MKLFAKRGYDETTLREIAERAGVSVGLLYRHFPSKRALVLALYDDLSRQFEKKSSRLPPGTWTRRFLVALRGSLSVLEPHRDVLRALIPLLVGGRDENLFGSASALSRDRVQRAFVAAVQGADDRSSNDDGEALGRTLYLVHLAIILWWLLDRSEEQRATAGLIVLVERSLPLAALALQFPQTLSFLRGLGTLVDEAFLQVTTSEASAMTRRGAGS